jgi:hypothetical protein
MSQLQTSGPPSPPRPAAPTFSAPEISQTLPTSRSFAKTLTTPQPTQPPLQRQSDRPKHQMSLCLSRAVIRQQQLLLRRAPLRSASSTSEVASAAKEKTAATASKAQEGLSRVTSSAGSAVGKAGEVAGKLVGGIGGRTGRLIGAVQCMFFFLSISFLDEARGNGCVNCIHCILYLTAFIC